MKGFMVASVTEDSVTEDLDTLVVLATEVLAARDLGSEVLVAQDLDLAVSAVQDLDLDLAVQDLVSVDLALGSHS
jgi:hypothetical protein